MLRFFAPDIFHPPQQLVWRPCCWLLATTIVVVLYSDTTVVVIGVVQRIIQGTQTNPQVQGQTRRHA